MHLFHNKLVIASLIIVLAPASVQALQIEGAGVGDSVPASSGSELIQSGGSVSIQPPVCTTSLLGIKTCTCAVAMWSSPNGASGSCAKIENACINTSGAGACPSSVVQTLSNISNQGGTVTVTDGSGNVTSYTGNSSGLDLSALFNETIPSSDPLSNLSSGLLSSTPIANQNVSLTLPTPSQSDIFGSDLGSIGQLSGGMLGKSGTIVQTIPITPNSVGSTFITNSPIGSTFQATGKVVDGSLFSQLVGQVQGMVDGGISQVSDVITNLLGGSSNALGIRNNNPGNITCGSGSWVGATGCNKGFVTFDTPEHGIRAAAINVANQSTKHDITTISQLLSKYAPASDHNNVPAYIAAVAGATGYGANQPLDFTDPTVNAKVVAAIIQHENGGVPYSATQFDTAYQMAFGSGANVSGALGTIGANSLSGSLLGNILSTGNTNNTSAVGNLLGSMFGSTSFGNILGGGTSGSSNTGGGLGTVPSLVGSLFSNIVNGQSSPTQNGSTVNNLVGTLISGAMENLAGSNNSGASIFGSFLGTMMNTVLGGSGSSLGGISTNGGLFGGGSFGGDSGSTNTNRGNGGFQFGSGKGTLARNVPQNPDISCNPKTVTNGTNAQMDVTWTCYDSDSADVIGFPLTHVNPRGEVVFASASTSASYQTYGVRCSNGTTDTCTVKVLHP